MTPDRWKILEATGPRKQDRRRRLGFWPDRASEQREIHAYHSQGLDYLGDWHTHPEEEPSPSPKDFASIESIVQESTHHLTGFLLCIVGRTTFPGGLWLSFHPTTGRHIPLKPGQ